MKKLLLAVVAVVALCACKGEREYLNFRGLSLGMSAKAMCDSLMLRGFELDTNLTDETTYVLYNSGELCRLDIRQHNDSIDDLLESYAATYNDSTSQLWQRMHDEFQKEFGWPEMAHRADLHKEAIYRTGRGELVLTLLNTYTPTLTVRYSTTPDEK
jgi:hypothetical protein